jgi:dTDP-4-amino-4,6-dideoxygalactose transaminase
MFYLKFNDLQDRTAFIDYMKSHNIKPTFHYIPLHSAPAGYKYGRFHGEDKFTTKESERLVRLPLYYNLKSEDSDSVIEKTVEFLRIKKTSYSNY